MDFGQVLTTVRRQHGRKFALMAAGRNRLPDHPHGFRSRKA